MSDDSKEEDKGERRINRLFARANEYDQIANIGEIARRSFGNNAFDGILTMTGVMIGSFVANVTDPKVVIITGLSTSIAIMISGGWGAYLVESSERKKELKELGSSTLTDLSKSSIGRASRFAVLTVSLVDGLSPFFGAFIVLLPFLFAKYVADIHTLYYIALGTALAALFGLGLWLGRVAKENLIVYGIKTLLAGVLSMLVGFLLSAL